MAEEYSLEKRMWIWKKSLTSLFKGIIQYIKNKLTPSYINKAPFATLA